MTGPILLSFGATARLYTTIVQTFDLNVFLSHGSGWILNMTQLSLFFIYGGDDDEKKEK